MLQFLENALKSPFGNFAFVFALLMLAFWSVHHITKWDAKLQHVDKLESNVGKHLDKLEGNIAHIKEDIAIIKAFITVFKESNNPFARSSSPVGLTEKGVEVAKDLDIKHLVDKHWLNILQDLMQSLKNDYNPYDIQQEAIRLGSKLEKYFTDKELDFIKKYAFRHGHNIASYDMIIGVHIRDKYFEINKIDIGEVDRFNPNIENS
jgi:hypothetical protein